MRAGGLIAARAGAPGGQCLKSVHAKMTPKTMDRVESAAIRSLSPEDLLELEDARQLLETPGLAAKLTNLIGTPIERGFELLPEKWTGTLQEAVDVSLNKALQLAVATLNPRKRKRPLQGLHKAAVIGTGGIGGALGLAALPVELPISTTIMLRSIADIARSEGENLREPEAKLACLEVFALGGKSRADDAVETGYYAVRATLATALADAARHIARYGLSREGAPALVRFISAVSARFGVVVSEKAAASAIPAIGALGGGAVNALFIDHFQNMARGHFKVRRLERKYGNELVEQAYRRLGEPVRID